MSTTLTTSTASARPQTKASSDVTIWRVRKGSSDGPFSLKSLVPKRKRNQSLVPKHSPSMESVPPPPPPKDNDDRRRSFSPLQYADAISNDSQSHEHTLSLSHVNVSTHDIGSLLASAPSFPVTTHSHMKIVPFRRPQGPPRVVSPAEKARIRLEAEREREFEARMAMLEEEQRQERLRARKEEIFRRSLEDEVRRKAQTEQDLLKAASHRMERERAEKEAEEIRRKELEERKKADRIRRLEESQKWQAWRDEQERKRQIIELMNDDQRRQVLEEKRMKRRELYNKLETESAGGVLLTGWLSTQPPQSLTWKRRYFTLNKDSLMLHRNQGDLAEPSDVIQVGDIRDVRDAGAIAEEEPEFIPFSFVVEEVEGGCWSMFTDDQETKDTLIAVLVHAAGLVDNSNSKTASTGSSFFSRIPRFYGI